MTFVLNLTMRRRFPTLFAVVVLSLSLWPLAGRAGEPAGAHPTLPHVDRPVAADDLEIRRQDIGRCLGASWHGATGVDGLNAEAKRLNAEAENLNEASASVTGERAAIELEQAAVDAESLALSARDEALAKERKRIDDAIGGPVKNKAEADRINGLIREFNDGVRTLQTRVESMRSRQAALSGRVDRFNASVGQFNERLAEFRQQVARYESRVSATREELAELEKKCAGRRRIVE